MTQWRRALAVAVVAWGLLGVAATGAAADDVDVTVDIPAGRELSAAVLRWGLSDEAGAGAFFGGCHFLSAGAAADSGGSRLWTEDDGLYRSAEGDVTIVRPLSSGALVEASWATRCLDPDGQTLTTATSSGNEVVLGAGQGTVDRSDGAVSIGWQGSFTVAFYGGLTYWSATDPTLTVRSDGTGELTALVSGFGTDRTGGSWTRLTSRVVTLATLSGVSLGEQGFTATPEYVGRSVTVAEGGTAQAALDSTNAAYWGAFPQSFVDFQAETGQGSYWYTSGGARDPHKVASALAVSWDAADPLAAAVGGTTASSSSSSASSAGAGAQATAGAVESQVLAQDVAAVPGVGGASTIFPLRQLLSTVPVPSGVSRQTLVWAVAVLLALASVLVGGLRAGWLRWPGRPSDVTDSPLES